MYIYMYTITILHDTMHAQMSFYSQITPFRGLKSAFSWGSIPQTPLYTQCECTLPTPSNLTKIFLLTHDYT